MVPNLTDPTAALVQMTEKAWTAWLDALDSGVDVVLKSPLFVWGMGRTLGARDQARARRDEALEKALGEARLASKGDLERLAADVHRLEAKLNEVLLRQEEQAASKEASAAPQAVAEPRPVVQAPAVPEPPAKPAAAPKRPRRKEA